MQWHQERQKVLAENVANADTPKFRPKDLTPIDFGARAQPAGGQQLALALTSPAHLSSPAATGGFGTVKPLYDVKPAGNAVNLEDQMIKVANNQMDYQAATSLYSRSMGLFKVAMGRN
jgi:flagellar basal-body rod protein FlgB